MKPDPRRIRDFKAMGRASWKARKKKLGLAGACLRMREVRMGTKAVDKSSS